MSYIYLELSEFLIEQFKFLPVHHNVFWVLLWTTYVNIYKLLATDLGPYTIYERLHTPIDAIPDTEPFGMYSPETFIKDEVFDELLPPIVGKVNRCLNEESSTDD